MSQTNKKALRRGLGLLRLYPTRKGMIQDCMMQVSNPTPVQKQALELLTEATPTLLLEEDVELSVAQR
jgi:hypothetical protein